MTGWPRPMRVVAALLMTIGLGLMLGGVVRGGVAGILLGIAGLLLLGLPLLLARQLRPRDTSGWIITWDLAEPLQFAAYVGERRGFFAADQTPDDTSEGRTWQRWWQQLVSDAFAREAMVDATIRAYADLPPQALARLIAAPSTGSFDPPDFASLGNTPELQGSCQEQWPAFVAVWTLEKPALLERMRRQGLRVRDDRIVRAAARVAKLPSIPAFFLRIDFVRWPAVYQRRISPQHLVLGSHYLQSSAAAELEAIIAGAVRELI